MISEVRIENFKAFKSLELPLGALTLLTGLNAAGKSTTMQALALLRQSYDSGSLAAKGAFVLNGDLVGLGIGLDVLHEDFVVGPDGRPSIGITLRIDETDYSWRSQYELARDREVGRLPISAAPPGLPTTGLFEPGFQYLRADRIVPAVVYQKSYDVAARRAFLGAQGEYTADFLRIHRDDPVDPVVRHPEATTTTLLDQVEAWLRELCPGVNVEAEDLQGTDSVRLSYGFFGRSGIQSANNRYRPTNVGFGLTYALPIVVACLTAPGGALILLENPEAHLHPRGQMMMARLAALAASSGAQIIVETHSDHVLNGVRLAVKESTLNGADVGIHYFRRERTGQSDIEIPQISISSPKLSDDGMLSHWPPGFFDEWDKALDRLLD